MLVLLPVCVTDLKEIVMVALPGAALSLSHCSSPAGVWGLLLPFWAKHFPSLVTGFPDDRSYCRQRGQERAGFRAPLQKYGWAGEAFWAEGAAGGRG